VQSNWLLSNKPQVRALPGSPAISDAHLNKVYELSLPWFYSGSKTVLLGLLAPHP